MFCDDAPTISMDLVPFRTPAQAKLCSSPTRQARASARTLYASLWHCSACEEDVRIYSKLTELLAGEMRTACPTCGKMMQTRGHARQSEASARPEIRHTGNTAAWAA